MTTKRSIADVRRWVIMLIAGALCVPFYLANTAPPAEAAPQGTVIASPCVNMRSSANSSAKILVCIPYKTKVTISCTVNGSSMKGPYGTTRLWNKVTWRGKTGYVTDAFLYTGTNGAVAKGCSTSSSSSSLSKKVDSFIGKWNGKRADYDGAYGSQCVDLFNYYNRDVVGAKRYPVAYAYQLWSNYDTSKYTRVSKGSAVKKGDVAIWGTGWSSTGHVAIVYQDAKAGSSSIKVFSQNHQYPYNGGSNATSVKTTLSTKHITGYLRPRT